MNVHLPMKSLTRALVKIMKFNWSKRYVLNELCENHCRTINYDVTEIKLYFLQLFYH